MQFHVNVRTDLKVVLLDSLTAIYHRPSGQTHIVAEPIPQILAAIGLGECDFDELLGRLDVSDSSDVRLLLDERLAEMSAAGLIAAR